MQGNENELNADPLSDETIISTNWMDIKVGGAMNETYTTTSNNFYTTLTESEKIIVNVLIEAQLAQGNELDLAITPYSTGHNYSDATAVHISTATWADYKQTAMSADYTLTSVYMYFTIDEKERVDGLIEAQTELGNDAVELLSTRTTTGHDFTDATTISTGTTWADLKPTAMEADYKDAPDQYAYHSFSHTERRLIDALIEAQIRQENDDPLEEVVWDYLITPGRIQNYTADANGIMIERT